jgi:hypothetical protein
VAISVRKATGYAVAQPVGESARKMTGYAVALPVGASIRKVTAYAVVDEQAAVTARPVVNVTT